LPSAGERLVTTGKVGHSDLMNIPSSRRNLTPRKSARRNLNRQAVASR
jgi:hypothetical protein